jgi:hypothetical protein
LFWLLIVLTPFLLIPEKWPHRLRFNDGDSTAAVIFGPESYLGNKIMAQKITAQRSEGFHPAGLAS